MEAKMKKAKAKSAARKAAALADQRMFDQWTALAESAEKNRLNDVQLMTLMTAGRAGDQGVKAQLIQGTQHLVFKAGFDWTSRSSKRRFEDIFGPLSDGQEEAIKDLLKNDRVDLSKAVADELTRSITAFRRQNSSTISQHPSTKSRRKKKQLRPYTDLTRTGECLADAFVEGETTVLPDAAKHKGPFTDQTGRRYVSPSKYHNSQDEFALIDLLDEFKDEWHQQVARLLFEEKTQEEIVEMTGRTVYAVVQATAKIEARLQPFWDQRERVTHTSCDPSSVPLPSTLPPVIAGGAASMAELELSLSV